VLNDLLSVTCFIPIKNLKRKWHILLGRYLLFSDGHGCALHLPGAWVCHLDPRMPLRWMSDHILC
jgi:hypothetical protein